MQKQILKVLQKKEGESLKFNSLLKRAKVDGRLRGEFRHQLNELIRQGRVVKSGKFYRIKSAGNRQASRESAAEITTVTGRFEKNKYFGFVIPDSRVVKNDIYISKKNYLDAKEGDKVVCELINYDPEENNKEPEGRIIEILGKAGNVDTEIISISRKYNLEKSFPTDVIEEAKGEAENFNEETVQNEISDFGSGRKDIRERVCFTIDPADAKDFDDAVSIEKNEDGYTLGVHIADVSYFVKENSKLDREALRRGTSVYLLNSVIPMLPEELSNDICSLKPNQDRMTFSVDIELNKNGKVKDYKIFKSVINSKRRFTYEEVQEITDKKKGDFKKELVLMDKVAKLLYKKRMKEGSIDFESREVKFDYDEKGRITGIKVKERLDSMRMIEEFMLLANKCVTEFVTGMAKKMKQEFPFIYRVHEDPDVEKLNNLSEFASQFGYRLHVDDKDSIKALLESIKDKPEEYLINDLLIRSMAKAIYDEKNIGHYGLGFMDYTHFTSPIRRYPDLIVHRILKDYLSFESDRNHAYKKIKYYKKILPDVCKTSSAMEQNAVQAEREIIKLKQIEYLSNHLGDEFLGIISGMVHYGMFVEIIEMAVEGLVRFRDIEDDYYEYSEKKHAAIGARRGKTFRIGQKVVVKILNTDTETKKIDFLLV